MNAALDPPVAMVLPTLTLPNRAPRMPPEPARGGGPRRIGSIMAEVLALHGLESAGAGVPNPRRSA